MKREHVVPKSLGRANWKTKLEGPAIGDEVIHPPIAIKNFLPHRPLQMIAKFDKVPEIRNAHVFGAPFLFQKRLSKFHEAIKSAIASTQVVNEYFVKRTAKLDE